MKSQVTSVVMCLVTVLLVRR